MRALDRLRRHAWPGAAVLLYHRVAALDVDPWGLAVTPRHFAEHLDVLRRRATVLPLGDLVARLRAGRVPRRAVAVTFDDGYEDNLLCAAPLLERYGIPATMFVTTGGLFTDGEFWWDELESLLLTPGELPSLLDTTIAGERITCSLDGATVYTDAQAREFGQWRPWKSPPTRRHALFSDLWRRLQVAAEDDRRCALRRLHAWAGTVPRERASHRRLRAAGVRQLARHATIEVAAHTVTHPRLSTLSPDNEERECRLSRQTLEDLVGRPVVSLAYPFGGPHDISERSPALARQAGFACACSSRAGAVRVASDPYRLPRCFVPDVPGDRFEDQLHAWQVAP